MCACVLLVPVCVHACRFVWLSVCDVRVCLFVCLFTHVFSVPFVHYPFISSCVHVLIRYCDHSFVCLFVRSCTRSISHSLIMHYIVIAIAIAVAIALAIAVAIAVAVAVAVAVAGIRINNSNT